MVVSAGLMAYSATKIKKYDIAEKKIPLMGVMGAFVFAAQMINFTIPATGSSGHIGGGILLAAMLGEAPAFLTITAVLMIQALFFADGGLLALGCNIFNMGALTCFVAYPFVFKPLVRSGLNKKSITIASLLSAVLGLQAGAFCVVLETMASGITSLPFSTFAALMQPIHLAIGVGEGIVTAAVLTFVWQVRPETLDVGVKSNDGAKMSFKGVIAAMVVLTALVGGGLSLYASSFPDGLEWAIEKTTGAPEIESSGSVFDTAAAVQEKTAFMPDYDFKEAPQDPAVSGTTVAGLTGALMTFVFAAATGAVLTRVKKKGTAA